MSLYFPVLILGAVCAGLSIYAGMLSNRGDGERSERMRDLAFGAALATAAYTVILVVLAAIDTPGRFTDAITIILVVCAFFALLLVAVPDRAGRRTGHPQVRPLDLVPMPAPPTGRPDRYEPLPGLLSPARLLLPQAREERKDRRGPGRRGAPGRRGGGGDRPLAPDRGHAARQRGRRARGARGCPAAGAPAPDRGAAPPSRGRSARAAAAAPSCAASRRTLTRDARAREAAGRLPPPPAQYSVCKPLAPAGRIGVSRLSCVAVTSEVPRQGGERAGFVGHPFRVRVDYGTGRYAWCKVSGRAGEGSFSGSPASRCRGPAAAERPRTSAGGLAQGVLEIGAAELVAELLEPAGTTRWPVVTT